MAPKSLFASLALAGLAMADVSPSAAVSSAAAATTVPVYLAVSAQPLVASVVTANPSMTSYSFTCAPGLQCDFAGRGGNLTVTDSSIYIMSVNGAAAGTPEDNLHVQCTSFGTASVVCSEVQNSILEGGVASSMSVVFTQGAESGTLLPLTVTAGADVLAAVATMAATSTAKTAAGASTGASKTGTAATASATKGAGAHVQASLAGVGMAAIAALLM